MLVHWLLRPLTCEMILMFKLPSWIAVYDIPYWEQLFRFHTFPSWMPVQECAGEHVRSLARCEVEVFLPGTQCLHRPSSCADVTSPTQPVPPALCPCGVNLTVVCDVSRGQENDTGTWEQSRAGDFTCSFLKARIQLATRETKVCPNMP